MHITITTNQIEIKNKTRNLIEKKINKISKHISDEEDLHSDIELSKETNHHNKGQIYRTEINLRLSGKIFRTEAKGKSIESSFMSALKELEREVSGKTEKEITLFKKGARKIKQILRFEK